MQILKAIAFLLILTIILVILSLLFSPKNNTKEFGMYDVNANGVLGERDNTIDVLIVGDSEAYTSITPMEMWREYGFTSYVCSSPGQSLSDSFKFVHTLTEKQKPKVVILEADNICKSVALNVPFSNAAKYVFPVLEYHNRWKSLKVNDFLFKTKYIWTDNMKGYYYSNEICEADCSNYMTYTTEKSAIPKLNELYMKALKEYCKLNDIKLMIISTPSTKNWNYQKHNCIKDFADKEGIEFLDLNILGDDLNIDWSKDTRDGGDHLNHNGALKVTAYLGKYLCDKNVLPDHRKDKAYEKWNEDLKKYEEIVNG